MRITVSLTAREAKQILCAGGFDHGWGVRKPKDSLSAYRKICAAISGEPAPVTVTTDPAAVKSRRYTDADHEVWTDSAGDYHPALLSEALLTEAAGPVRCRDCGTTIERGDPCVDMRDGTGDVLCCACGDEAGMIL